MNMLVDGEWRTDVSESTTETGAFERSDTAFREWIAGSDVPSHVDATPSDRFHPEPDRYHLYVSYACPWAHRTLLVRALMGLQEVISVSIVDPWRGADGWQFSPAVEGCTADHVNGFDYLREVYLEADPEATGRVTVPVLWDTVEGTIVNNESREIVRQFTTAFGDLATTDVDLAPADRRAEIDRVITAIYEPINNGVYRAGFATEQGPYDEAIDDLFDALDRWDEVLSDRRFLLGDRLTEADVCLFTTLVRFDQVYHTHFMCNVKQIREYDNLWPYLRDLYQLAGVAETVRMDHIKEHYYTTHPDVTPSGIIARGPDLDFEDPHDRDRLGGDVPTVHR
ncbi:MAG: glutathione S-transferase family protein [Halobacteriota archaeon]